MILKRAEPYDAIVVGSGPAGATTARELTMAGARVLLLEAGREVPTSEFAGHKWPYQYPRPRHGSGSGRACSTPIASTTTSATEGDPVFVGPDSRARRAQPALERCRAALCRRRLPRGIAARRRTRLASHLSGARTLL